MKIYLLAISSMRQDNIAHITLKRSCAKSRAARLARRSLGTGKPLSSVERPLSENTNFRFRSAAADHSLNLTDRSQCEAEGQRRTDAQAERLVNAVDHALEHSNSALIAEKNKDWQEALRQWSIVFNGEFPKLR